MLLPLSILETFLKIEDPQYVADKLSISGTETSLKTFGLDIKNVKVGQILSIQKLENLNLCKVFVGDADLDIVTSASNVFVGAKIPVAPPGAFLNGKTIEPKSFKGVLSQGMFLSAKELGLDDADDGILILDEDVKLGADVAKLLDFGEVIFECEITPNRGDLLSVIGLTREISALIGKPHQFNIDIPSVDRIELDIHIQTQTCYRYTGTLIKDVQVKSSKLWLKKALWKMGLKTISNVVDITNYAMMLLGQPLHAFDKDKIGTNILIREGNPSETLKALDKKDYEVNGLMVIADERKPIALAGIIGGLESAVSSNTKNIFLESALFDPYAVRKASKSLKISTDASYRFERGVDINISLIASLFAANLIQKETNAKIVGYKEVIKKDLPKKVFFLPMNDYIRYTDLEFDRQKVSGILSSLDIPHKPMRCGVEFEVPSHRYYDIDSHIDLIEEIVRVMDFNSFESKSLSLIPKPSDKKDIIYDMKNRLTGLGLKEVINLSFDRIEDYDALGLEKPSVEVKNPILPSFRFLRRYLTPSMLRLADQNIKKHIYDFAIFEIADVFKEDSLSTHLCILLVGNKRTYPKTKWSIHHIKEILKAINKDIAFGFSDYRFLHPYQQGAVIFEDRPVGFFGLADQDIVLCELELPKASKQVNIREISKYPPVVRDLSLIMSIDFDVQKLIFFIRSFFKDLLEDVVVFDFYKGEQIEEDKKSVGVRLSLRALDRSLEDQEVNALMDRLLELLRNEGVELRYR